MLNTSESILVFPISWTIGEALIEDWTFVGSWRPHLTLAYPPYISKEEWPQLRPLLAEYFAALSPVEITLAEVKQFMSPEYVLWLKPEDAGVIMRIRNRLEERFPRYIPRLPYEFMPHVTVAVFAEMEKLVVAHRSLASVWRPFQCRLDQVFYVV